MCNEEDGALRHNGSQQVSSWSVHEFVQPLLTQLGSWPMVGTPAWCVLDDDDPAKVAALLDAAQHWALRIETSQQDLCDASRLIAGAADWSVLAQKSTQRNAFYAAHPWLTRVSS
jgi:hypothetical protein